MPAPQCLANAWRPHGEDSLDWSDLYERLIRRPDRPDPAGSAELERRVRAWATLRALRLDPALVDEVTGETCAEVWRTLNLARGGAAFEGFVQGRFVEALRRVPGADPAPPAGALPGAPEGESAPEGEPEPAPVPTERIVARLAELRLRNPRHHRAIALLYEARATPAEAADELGVDVWTLRNLAARARLVLAQGRERQAQKQRPERKRGPGPRPKPGRPGSKPRQSGRR